tara:strand:+ start:50 stop:349 length:300 start_codon:yes stop_codon:yes gene_type:complete
MRFLHVFKRKKFIFLNIFLFSYILINFFDGDRGLFSYIDKKNHKESLVNKKIYLEKNLNILENKNKLLSEKINFDYLDMLIRQKLKFGHTDEVVIKLNE